MNDFFMYLHERLCEEFGDTDLSIDISQSPNRVVLRGVLKNRIRDECAYTYVGSQSVQFTRATTKTEIQNSVYQGRLIDILIYEIQTSTKPR